MAKSLHSLQRICMIGSMENSLKIVIIGGSSGMGLAIAQKLRALGHEIVIAGRSQDKLKSAVDLIGKAESYVVDIMHEEEITSFFEKVGPFDHLVTSAANFAVAPFLTMPLDKAKNFFDGKFWGQYLAAKHGAPHMRPGGSITFFCGTASQRPFAHFAAGSAINAAIEGLTRALALELAPLRVNAIAPGTIATPVWDTVPEKERLLQFEETAKRLPVKRIGTAEDISEAALYLIQCGYATGSIVYVDGGSLLI